MVFKIPEKILSRVSKNSYIFLGCLKILKYYFRLSKNCVLEILNNVWLLSLKSLRKLHINAISCWHFPLTSCHLVLKTTRRDFPSHGPPEEFFFRKRVTTFDTLKPEINQRPLKTFFDSPYLGESRSTIFFFPLLSNRISCWKWRRCWGKRFSMTTKRVRSSDWHQRIFLFRIPLAFYFKKTF